MGALTFEIIKKACHSMSQSLTLYKVETLPKHTHMR